MLADLEDLAAMPMPSKDTAEDEVGGDPTNIQDVESAIHEIPGNF